MFLFGLLFFFILGIKELFFIRRREVCLIATTLTFLITTFLVLWSLALGVIIFYLLPFAIATFILSRSILQFKDDNYSSINLSLSTLIITYLLTELIWAFTYAPFSLITSTILLTATFFLINSLYFIFENNSPLPRDVINTRSEELTLKN